MLSVPMFVILLCAATAPGLLALQLTRRRLHSFDSAKRVLAPVVFTLYGYLPSAAIAAGLAPQSAPTALAAFGFFVLFGVSANVAIHSALIRLRFEHQGEQAVEPAVSPDSSLERMRDG